MKSTLISDIANTIVAYQNCVKSGNMSGWKEKHLERLRNYEKNFLPSGSGIDNGTKINLDLSKGERVILHGDYHCMDDNGMYAGWVKFRVTVTPSFIGDINVKVGITGHVPGGDRDGLRDYLTETYDAVLRQVADRTLKEVSHG